MYEQLSGFCFQYASIDFQLKSCFAWLYRVSKFCSVHSHRECLLAASKMPQRSQIPLEQNPTFTAQKSGQGGFARRFLGHQIVIFYTKRNSTKLFLKLSDLKSNFTLNLGYLHPALNNPVLNFKKKKKKIYIYSCSSYPELYHS